MNKHIILKVINTIEKHSLINKEDKILAGLSGGADSVCLIHILKTLSEMYNMKVYAAHINHNMRKTADRDMNYSVELCERLGIECFVKSADVILFAKENKISSELAGRKIRYDFFDEICRNHNINKIATAHNMNDRAETIFMNFIRGSGLGGLCGIPYARGNIIRPVMDLTRGEIEEYCRDSGLDFMTDETNLETVYTRNKLRLDVIPYIQKNINKNFIRRIVENSDIIMQENDFIQGIAEDIFEKAFKISSGVYSLDISKLTGCHTAVLRRVMSIYFGKIYNTAHNMEHKFIDAAIFLMRGESGKSIDLPQNIVLKNEYGILSAEKRAEKYSKENYKIIKEYNVLSEKPSKNSIFIKTEFADNLSVRFKKDGDYFYPYGMEGRKKLKKFFSDMKIPKQMRENIPLIVSEMDEIIWVAGIRADRRFLSDAGEIGVKIEVRGQE